MISSNTRQRRCKERGLLMLTFGFFCPRCSSVVLILGALNELRELRGKQEAPGHKIQSLFLSIRGVAEFVDVLFESILLFVVCCLLFVSVDPRTRSAKRSKEIKREKERGSTLQVRVEVPRQRLTNCHVRKLDQSEIESIFQHHMTSH